MAATHEDRNAQLSPGVAIKAPCRLATTVNITLNGEQTIDGIAGVSGDRIFVKNQTDTTANGIYAVSTGSWTREPDFDGTRDVVEGTIISVNQGATNSDTMWRVTNTGTIVFGTTTLTFERALVNDSATMSFLQSGTGAVARSVQSKERDVVSVKDFGAVGDGVTDDSAAFASWFAYINAQTFSGVYNFGRCTGHIPAGDYIVNAGIAATAVQCQITGDGPSVTRLNIGAGQYFITATSTIAHFELSDLALSGGKGYLAHTFTGVNVQAKFIVRNVEAYLYTETAFGTCASDFPYWIFENVLFYGAAALTSKGVVHMGNPDQCSFDSCSFLRNRYHVKLERGNNAKFRNCDFLRFTAGGGAPVLVDVWIVPYTTAVNGGAGLSFDDCKFGNETLGTTDIRILVADEAAGTNALDKNHATTVSTGFVDGLSIRGGTIVGASGMARGFIYSYTPNIRDLKCTAYWDGSRYPMFLEFDAAVTVTNDRSTDSHSLDLQHLSAPFETVFGKYSNAKMPQWGRDPMCMLFGQPDWKSDYSRGYDPGYTELWNQASSGIRAMTLSNVSRANINDSTGDIDASEVTYSNVAGTLTGDLATPTAGRMAFAEVECMVGSATPLTQIDVRVVNSASDIIARRLVAIPAIWQKLEIPFVVRDTASGVHVQILPGDYVAGVKTKVKLGRVHAYHAAEPTDVGGRYLTGRKTFDYPNIGAGAISTTTITVVGAAVGDLALVSSDQVLPAGVYRLTPQVTAADTVTDALWNSTAGGLDPASAVLYAQIWKRVAFN